MFNIGRYFKDGLKNTILLINNAGISHAGQWVQVYPNTLLDRWHVGDFSSVEYTISIDLTSNYKEVLKVLVTASVDIASVVIYARNTTGRDIVQVSATVNNSYVDVILSPLPIDDELQNSGAKAIFTANYFHSQVPLLPAS